MAMNEFASEIGWKKRLAIVLSFLWLAVFAIVGTSERDGFALFVALGLLPVATLWGIAWVWSAYRKQKTSNESAPSGQPERVESSIAPTVENTLEAPSLALPGAHKKQHMTEFPKTRAMNIFGAVGWSITGVALFINKMDEQSFGILATIVLMYLVLVSIPVGSAYALSEPRSMKLRAQVLRANWALIGFWCLSIAGALYFTTKQNVVSQLWSLASSALAFGVPAWINIRALRSLLVANSPRVGEVTLEQEQPAYTPEESAAKQSATRIGWALLAFALSTPFISIAAGAMTPYKAGELAFYLFFGWLVAATVVDRMLNKRNPLTRAKGRIGVGLFAVIAGLGLGVSSYQDTRRLTEAKKELIEQFMTSAVEAKRAPAESPAVAPVAAADPVPMPSPNKSASGSSTDKMVALMGAMQTQVKLLAENFGNIERKFNSVNLGEAFKPENVASREEIQKTRKKVAYLQSVVEERKAILRKYFVTVESLIRNSGLDAVEMNNAIQGFNSGKSNTERMYAELGQVQTAYFKAATNLLDYCESFLGRPFESDGLRAMSDADMDELVRLNNALPEIAAREQIIVKQIEKQALERRQELVNEYKK